MKNFKHFLYKKLPTLVMTFIVLLFSSQVFSQEAPYVKAVLDTNAIVIGQQTKMKLEVIIKNNEKLFWANIPGKLAENAEGVVEVVSYSPIDTVLENDRKLYRQTLAITSFDSGFYALEPIQFAYQVGSDTTLHFFQTSSIWLEVSTVAIDTTQTFHDIKPLMEAPLTWREILTYAGIGLGCLIALGGIIFLIMWLIRKYGKKDSGFTLLPQKPKLPPHVIALEHLETLRLKKLWQAGKVKEYYSELTDIVREYIEIRFGVQASEMTTDEILYGLKSAGINPQAMEKLTGTLQTADLVKFAKASPLPLENDSVLINSVDFVQETKTLPQSEHREISVSSDVQQFVNQEKSERITSIENDNESKNVVP